VEAGPVGEHDLAADPHVELERGEVDYSGEGAEQVVGEEPPVGSEDLVAFSRVMAPPPELAAKLGATTQRGGFPLPGTSPAAGTASGAG